MEPIIIEREENYFTVRQGDRYSDHLGCDEMLRQVIGLCGAEFKPFPMRTKEEHAAEDERWRAAGVSPNVVED